MVMRAVGEWIEDFDRRGQAVEGREEGKCAYA